MIAALLERNAVFSCLASVQNDWIDPQSVGAPPSPAGTPAKLSRPLDWLVVADHSDNMGFFPDLLAGKPHMLADPTGRDWYDRVQSGDGVAVALEIIGKFSQGQFPDALSYTPDSSAFKARQQAHSRTM